MLYQNTLLLTKLHLFDQITWKIAITDNFVGMHRDTYTVNKHWQYKEIME